MKQELSIVTTEDGSSTIFDSAVQQHYHSTHGAIQESELVFIKNGLEEVLKIEYSVNILEVGMGTGLNVLLSILKSKELQVKMNYVAIEPFPLSEEITAQLNYTEVLGGTEAKGYFNKIHKAGWLHPEFLSDYFILSKIQAQLQDITLTEKQFHVIYFDAFDPHTHPNLWTQEVFEKMYKCLKPGGILVTYSTNGNVRRALSACGFTIEKLAGPPGKREVLRAKREILKCNFEPK